MPQNIFFKEISIKNYKSLISLTGENFGKINLITGKNNAGKTSFLEALFLNLGPSNVTLPINILGRLGLNRLFPEGSTNLQYFFNSYDSKKVINFVVKTKNHGTSALEISLRNAIPDEIAIVNARIKDQEKGGVNIPQTLEYKVSGFGKKRFTNKLLVSPATGIIPLMENSIEYPESVYISSELVSFFDNEIERYDRVNKENRINEFDDVIRMIEPNLKRTSLGIHNSLPTILADVGYGLAPLNLLGSGGKKLAQIFLALSCAQNGIVLIDEIEGSFHYSILPSIWKAIVEFSRRNNTQIFATTHSGECLKAAYEVARASDFDDIKLHRLERNGETSNFYSFDGEKLEAMLSNDWDLR